MGEFNCKVKYTDAQGDKQEVSCYGTLEEDSNVLVVWGEDGEEIYCDGVESSWTDTVKKIAEQWQLEEPIYEVTSC